MMLSVEHEHCELNDDAFAGLKVKTVWQKDEIMRVDVCKSKCKSANHLIASSGIKLLNM